MSIRFRSQYTFLLALITGWAASGQTYTISTVAGGGLPVNIPGASASLDGPSAVAVDAKGNVFFTNANTVLRLDAASGIVTVVAGNGTQGFSGDDGLAVNAQLSQPSGVAVDLAGNLFIADVANNRIRKVTNGVITTVAGNGTFGNGYVGLGPNVDIGDDGPATIAALQLPCGIAVDAAGDLYIADTGDQRIRKVTNGIITTVAGNGAAGYGGNNGPATSAQLYSPQGVAVDSSGNLYIADTYNQSVRKVANGIITTVAGMGPGLVAAVGDGDGVPATSVLMYVVYSVAVDSAGNLYIAEGPANRIRKVANGIITTAAGNGTYAFSGDNGPAASAGLVGPQGVAVDTLGNLYIADTGDNRVRKVADGIITTIAGDGAQSFAGDKGLAIDAQLFYPSAVAVDSSGNLFIADTLNNRIREVSKGVITTVAGNGVAGFSGDTGPATGAELYQPLGVAVDSAGNLYIADTMNDRIRKVSGGVITTIAGTGPEVQAGPGGFSGDNGPAVNAQLNAPAGVALDSAGNLYIADSGNGRIREITSGIITTIAGGGSGGSNAVGDNGPATSAHLAGPNSVAVDSNADFYIADTFDYRIRKVSGGVITTVAGGGTGGDGPATNAQLTPPFGVAIDSAHSVYIAGEGLVRKVGGGVITTIAGGGSSIGDNGTATNAQLSNASGIAIGFGGSIYIADSGNNRIRLLTPGTMPAINPGGIVPNDSTVSVIQSGSWISIFGTNLAAGTFLWNADFPQSLGGVSVNVNNNPAYLWFVSPCQINLQAPDDTTTGVVSVSVTTPSGTATSTVTLAAYGPSFSLLGDGKHVAAEIATPSGTGAYGGGTYDLVGPSNTFSYNTRPVKAGETLTLYGVGFGPTTPHVPAGQVFSGSAITNSPVTITIGGVNAPVAFAGITEAGLYQINVTVPGAPSGDQPLSATVNSVQTLAGPVVTVQ